MKNLLKNILPKRFDKYWKKTKNWHSKNLFKKTERLDYQKGDYNLPKKWTNIFNEDLIFPSSRISLGFIIKK
jgi:hypothetical protein